MLKRQADGPLGGAHAASASSATSTAHARKRPRVVGVKTALPVADEAWRRKMMRAKDAVVLRAKTKKTYAKVKARALAEAGEQAEAEVVAMHPDRQARLEDDEQPEEEQQRQYTDRRRGDRRPPRAKTDTLLKAQQEAEQRQAEAEQRAAERTAKRAERVRMQKAMVRARRVEGGGGGGYKNGGVGSGGGGERRKLGRESTVLLDRVRKMMGK